MDYTAFGFLFTSVYTSLLLHIGDVAAGSSGCPDILSTVSQGHTFVHEHVCYLFVGKEEYWKAARHECYRLGGEMLSIESEEVMDFITDKLGSRELGWDRNGVWLGLRKSGSAWRWTNGRPATFLRWADGEPSEVLGSIIGLEDCAQMRRSSSWLWYDHPCGGLRFHYNYICEFPLSRPSDTEGQVAPSAASQEEDNGNGSALIIILGMGMAIIILMMVIAALLHFHHRRSKRRHAETELPIRYANNHHSHTSHSSLASAANQRNHCNHNQQHSSSNTCSSGGSNSCSGQSSGSIPPTTVVPPGRPPAPPAAIRAQQEEARAPFLYSEVNRPRGQSNSIHVGATASQGVGSPGRGAGREQDSMERVPLVSPSDSNESLTRDSLGNENLGTPPVSDTLPSQYCFNDNPASVSSGDYVDMNSLICHERRGLSQGQAQATAKKEADLPDEDKHTYTNVDHRAEKAENLYEVLP